MNWFLLITIRRREGLVKDLTNHLSVSLCLSQNAISFRSIYMNKTSRSPSADGCSKCFITTDFFHKYHDSIAMFVCVGKKVN